MMDIYCLLNKIKSENEELLYNPFILVGTILDYCSKDLENRYYAKCLQKILLVTNVFEILKKNKRNIAINLLQFKNKKIELSDKDYQYVIDICISVIYKDYYSSLVKMESINEENNINDQLIVLNINSDCGNIEVFIDDENNQIECFKNGVMMNIETVCNNINIRNHCSNLLVHLPKGNYELSINSDGGNIDIYNNTSIHINGIIGNISSGNLYIKGKVNDIKVSIKYGNVLGIITPLLISNIIVKAYEGNITLNLNKVPYSKFKVIDACYLKAIAQNGNVLIY